MKRLEFTIIFDQLPDHCVKELVGGMKWSVIRTHFALTRASIDMQDYSDDNVILRHEEKQLYYVLVDEVALRPEDPTARKAYTYTRGEALKKAKRFGGKLVEACE